jgi:hypothetical protein
MKRVGIVVLVLALTPTAQAGSPPPPAAGVRPTVVFAEPVVPPLAVHTPFLLAREFGQALERARGPVDAPTGCF